MATASNETKPYIVLNRETDEEAELLLRIESLKVGRRIQNPTKKLPKNAKIIDADFSKQSLNYAIEVKPKGAPESARRTYRLNIKRLPTEINPEKTKIRYEKDKVTIILHKKVNEPWSMFTDSDFETIHNFKS